MTVKWKTVPITDLYEIGSGLSKPRSEFGFGHGFLTFKDVLDNYFVPDELSALVNSSEKEQSNCSIRRGDVFLTRTSETQPELGMSCVALKEYPKATFNGFTKRLRPKDSESVVPEYAAYYFRGPMFRQGVTSMSSLSTRASLNNEMISRLTIVLPPIPEQKSIGAALKALDDKIEHNRQTSQTLEKLARAIFKAWFIDFEPVRAKTAGAKSFPGMPQEAFAALPKRLVETELGEAPEGWEVGTMGDIGLQRREQVSPSETETGTPYIGLEHMPRRCVSLGEWGMSDVVSSAKSRFRRGDILFGKLRPYFHKVGLAPVDGVCSTDIVVLHTSETVWTEWLLLLVSSDEFVSHTDQTSAGTKMPRTNWKDMAAYKVLLAPTKLVSVFHQIMRPMFELITHSVHESSKLAELRDYLLPKLLSGQVRVREAEKVVQRKS